MPLTELITWRPASEPPDDNREVLAIVPGYVADIGYYKNGIWFMCESGYQTDTVTHWAELPKGPTAEDK